MALTDPHEKSFDRDAALGQSTRVPMISESLQMMSKIMDFDKNDASGGNLIENYRSYNIWKFSCIELSILKIKTEN